MVHLQGQLQQARTAVEIAGKSEAAALERLRAMEEAALLEEVCMLSFLLISYVREILYRILKR